MLCTYVLCNIVISSLVHHVRPNDGLLEKRAKTCCLSFDS